MKDTPILMLLLGLSILFYVIVGVITILVGIWGGFTPNVLKVIFTDVALFITTVLIIKILLDEEVNR